MIRNGYWKKIFFLIILNFIYSSSIFGDNRDSSIQPKKVVEVIGVKEGMKIGIAGAGKGYFSFKMSKVVGKSGRIYANEINENHLEYIREKCKRENIKNITTILGKTEDPLFPVGKLDMVFMCYVFHDLEKPVTFLKNVKRSLRPGGTVVVLEQDPGKTGSSHFYTKEVLIKMIRESEYKVLRIETFLKKDNIYICIPKI